MKLQETVSLLTHAQPPPEYVRLDYKMLSNCKEILDAILWIDSEVQGRLRRLPIQQPRVLQGSSLLPTLKGPPQVS